MHRSALTIPELAAYLTGRLEYLTRAGVCPGCAIRFIAVEDDLPARTIEALLGEFHADWVKP
jgi:hypothetical protein